MEASNKEIVTADNAELFEVDRRGFIAGAVAGVVGGVPTTATAPVSGPRLLQLFRLPGLEPVPWNAQQNGDRILAIGMDAGKLWEICYWQIVPTGPVYSDLLVNTPGYPGIMCETILHLLPGFLKDAPEKQAELLITIGDTFGRIPPPSPVDVPPEFLAAAMRACRH